MEPWVIDLMQALDNAGRGRKGRIVEQYAKLAGVSVQTAYRKLKDAGHGTSRKTRSDAGECCITDEQLEYIATLVETSRRQTRKGAYMPVAVALDIAERNGKIAPGCVSVSRVQALLREKGLSRKHLNAPDPHIQQRSLHPNHVHFFDVSICIQYYLKNGSIGIRNEKQFYKNKPQNFKKIKEKLHRYVLVDHFSGAFFFKYYYSGGETTLNLFDFLCSAWEDKGDSRYPFRGPGRILRMDPGAANISEPITHMLEALDIEVLAGSTHTPRSQGCVEVMHSIIEQHFESRLIFDPAHNVDQLNQYALDHCIGFNATRKHTRHGMTRMGMWMRITPEQLVELPDREILKQAFRKTADDRLVGGDYCISFNAKKYRLKHIPGLNPGETKVDVYFKPLIWPDVIVAYAGKEYQVEPVGFLAPEQGGFEEGAAIIGEEHKSQPKSTGQEARDKAQKIAGTADNPKAVPFGGNLEVFGFQAERAAPFIPKAGQEHALSARNEAPVLVDTYRVRVELANSGVTLSRRQKAWLERHYPETIPAAEVEALKAKLADGWEPEPDSKILPIKKAE